MQAYPVFCHAIPLKPSYSFQHLVQCWSLWELTGNNTGTGVWEWLPKSYSFTGSERRDEQSILQHPRVVIRSQNQNRLHLNHIIYITIYTFNTTTCFGCNQPFSSESFP
jgi:hypothetical protein